jgi:hypothetical protein
VDHITTLAATTMPADIERRLPQAKGFEEKLARPAGDVEMLVIKQRLFLALHFIHVYFSAL